MRVLIVDDHQLFASGLELMLHGISQFEESDLEINLVASIEELSALVTTGKQVDLILLDYHLPKIAGDDLINEVRSFFPQADIVVISSDDSSSVIYDAMSYGAVGFIPKSSSKKILTGALQLILNGGSYFPPLVYESVISEQKKITQNLTKRQKSVLFLAGDGLQNKQIAAELNISEGTVKAHLHAAFKELGVRNRTQAALVTNELIK